MEVSLPMASGRMVSASSTSVSGRMPNSVVSDPCGSVSITSTRWPRSDRPWASVTAVVVLDTPPLKLPMLMVTASAPAGRSLLLRYSRAQEYESDDLGIRYLRDAGYGEVTTEVAPAGPFFYAEEHHSNVFAMEAMVTSLVFEGVLERFPRVVARRD